MRRPRLLTAAAALLLAACAGPREVLVRPQVHEVPVLRYAEIPEHLTAPLELPAYPAGRLACTHLEGQILLLEGIVARANTDRAEAARLSGALVEASTPATPDEAQP